MLKLKTCSLFFLLFIFSTITYAQEMFKTIQPGDTLVYQVYTSTSGYHNFFVAVREFGKKIVLDHTTDTAGGATTHIVITEEAVKKGNAYTFRFYGGQEVMTDRLAFFMSKKNRRELKHKRKVFMDLGPGNKGIWEGGTDGFGVRYKGMDMEARVFYIGLNYYETSPVQELIILDEDACPLILDYSNGAWSMRLTEIR